MSILQTLTVLAVSVSVTVGVETIRDNLSLVAGAVFIEVVPVKIDLVFVKHLVTAVKSNTVIEVIVLTVDVSPATSVIIITRTIIVSVTVQSLYPNAGSELSIFKGVGNIVNCEVAFSTDLSFGIEVVPIGTDHLPSVSCNSIDVIVPVSVFFGKTGKSMSSTAFALTANEVVTGSLNLSTPINYRLTSFAVCSVGVTINSTSCILVEDSQIFVMVMPRVNNVIDHCFNGNGTAKRIFSINKAKNNITVYCYNRAVTGCILFFGCNRFTGYMVYCIPYPKTYRNTDDSIGISVNLIFISC